MRLIAVLALAAALAGGEARLIRGPWWWHDAAGAPRVAVAVRGAPAVPGEVSIDGQPVAVDAVRHPCPDPGDGTDGIVVLRLPPGTRGELQLTLAGRTLSATLAPPPARDAAPVRMAVLAPHAWPDAEAWQRLTEALGGPPQLALVLGRGAPARLGSGGWEGAVPLAIVAEDEPALAAVSDGEHQRWRRGLGLGILGLPAAEERTQAHLALARDLSPWLVYLDVPAAWDPALSRPRPGRAADLAPLIAACQQLRAPLILAAGGVGLVSEPLSAKPGEGLKVQADGVRYVLPCPAEHEGLAALPPEIAVVLPAPLLAGLEATLGRLRLVFSAADGPLELVWEREPGPRPPPAALAQQLAAAGELLEPEAQAQIADWLWRAPSELLAELPDPALVARLRDAGGWTGRLLARRLLRLAAEQPTYPAPPGEPDPLLRREVLLARLVSHRGKDAKGWQHEAATSPDPWVLRALLHDLARDPERTALPALRERVALQAAGALPLDPDPLDQHRLMHAVFDDLTASPTELRPWALALRGRVDPLARGPLERFLQRHGEQRPVP